MASQQPLGDCCEAINGFTTASWQFQNHQYFIKKMCKWLHSNLLEIAVKQSMASQQLPGDSKTSDISFGKCANGFIAASGNCLKQSMASQQLPRDSKTIDISMGKCANCFATASWRFQTMNPPTPQELERVGPQTKHRIRRLLKARACQTPDKASKPASNLSEPTCKAATRVEVSPAKPKPATSPKPKPAASIEQSRNEAIESNLQIEPSKLQRFPMRPPAGRQRAPSVAQRGETSEPASF